MNLIGAMDLLGLAAVITAVGSLVGTILSFRKSNQAIDSSDQANTKADNAKVKADVTEAKVATAAKAADALIEINASNNSTADVSPDIAAAVKQIVKEHEGA